MSWRDDIRVEMPEATAFITGAGISADAPTNGPVGIQLMKRALHVGFREDVRDPITRAYAALQLPGADTRPRLEAVLEIVERCHGSGVLSQLLSDLEHADPNELHRFFARHLQRGGRHVTANFDVLVEKALGGEHEHLTHIHGSLARGVNSLGATLSRIERGFDPDLRDRVRAELFDPAVRNIVIVGYSGLDYFDMNPFLRESVRGGFADGLRVTLLLHDRELTEPKTVPALDLLALQPFRTNRPDGPVIEAVTGPTTAMLAHYADAWQVTPPVSRPRIDHPRPEIAVSPEEKLDATLELYAHMGLFAAIDDLGLKARTLEPRIRSERDWARARYRRYRRIAQRRSPGDDPASVLDRRNIVTRAHWIRGAYFRAYRSLLRSLPRAQSPDLADTLVGLDTLELWGRILVHIGRCPDVRRFATDARRRAAKDAIEAYRDRNSRLGIESQTRIKSVLADLDHDETATNRDIEEWDETIASFDEFESLHNRLQYEHGRLRKAVNLKSPSVMLDDFKRMETRYQIIGQSESAFRVRFLPGGAFAFPFLATAWRLLFLDTTLWHKVRLGGGLFLERQSERSRVVRDRARVANPRRSTS